MTAFYFFNNMISFSFKKWIFIYITTPFKTMNKLKRIFKPLKCHFRYSFNKYDYYPILWCSEPKFIHIMSKDVMWKDKYDTPRYENNPYIWIHIWKLNLIWYWDLPYIHPKNMIDDYWEQALWYLYYYDNTSYGCNKPDINKAKDSWPWMDSIGRTTWSDKFLI